MLPLSVLCNPCLSRIILPRDDRSSDEEDDPGHSYALLQDKHEGSVCFPVVSKEFCSPSLTVLTVRKKPLVFSGGGFVVTDSATGRLLFMVDGRGPSSRDRLLLMDGVGKPLLTLHRKVLTMCNRWDGFHGDKCERQKPIFSVRKSFTFKKNGATEVYLASDRRKKGFDYKVEGSYVERYCAVYNGPSTIVAEVKRKRATSDVMLSKDVFNVVVKAGLDQAFIMGLVVILHQMSGENLCDK